MTKVSIIVPVYNVENYVEKCLQTLVNQTLEGIEIIVVNDGSTDKSKEIIQRFIKENLSSNIIYLEKENGGLSDARNYGMNYATGEYIAFLDSDDYVENTIYEKMYNKAISENADYVECDFYWEYPNKKREDKGVRYTNKKEMFVHARVVAWNKLIKKEIIKEKFPYGMHYEDVEFFYKLLPNVTKFAFIAEPLIHYIQRDNSLVNKQGRETAQIFEILDNVIKYYKENNLYNDYLEELEYTYSRLLLCSSLKRIKNIPDKEIKEKLIYETWGNLNSQFPKWKENKYIKTSSFKNLYMRCINKVTYKILSKIKF